MTTFNSNDIYVFPCARPGVSSLASEYNFTHLSGRVSNKTSYVIGSVNNILQVVLDGYYFEIKTNTEKELESLCTKKLILWLETLSKSDSDSTNDWAHVTRRVCGVKYEDSTGTWTKQQDLDNKLTGKFSALYAIDIVDDPSDPSTSGDIEDGLTYICLNLNDKTNRVDNIHKGIEDKLTLGTYVKDGETKEYETVKDYVEALEDTLSDTYATKTELKATDDKAVSNDAAIKNLTGRLDGIVAQGGEPNVINNIKVNGVVQEIIDKAVDITVPVISDTKVSDLNDGSVLLDRTTSLETAVYGVKASEGVEAVEGLVDRVEALEAVDNATQAELDVYKEVVTGAIAEALQVAKNYADEKDDDTVYNDEELRGRIEAIEGDYLKEEDKYDDTTLAGRVTVVEGKVANLEAAIEGSGIYAIAFDANGGTGIMTPVICISDRYSLPTEAEISFIPPDDNQHFAGWCLKAQAATGDDTTTRIENNELIGIEENTIVYAMWAANTET